MLNRTPEALLQSGVVSFLRRQQSLAIHALNHGLHLPSFAQDAQAMAEALRPHLASSFVRGGRRAARQIGAVAPRVRVHVPAPVKLLDLRLAEHHAIHKHAPLSLAAWIFRLFFPKVEEAVRRLTFDFCATTNRTTHLELKQARSLLASELREGLEQGEALARLTKRVKAIFNSERAYTIARTETARAMELGGLLAAEQSGVCKSKVWMAAPQCCDVCQSLDGKEVDLRQPFVVLPGGGAYSVVQTAPLHPHCRCTTEWKVHERYL